jgi:hypothetical protein
MTWYLAFCVQCNGGIGALMTGRQSVVAPMPFAEKSARTAWVDEHMEGTNHSVLLMDQRDRDTNDKRT